MVKSLELGQISRIALYNDPVFTVQQTDNRGYPTLISQSHVMFTTKESGFGSLSTNRKREHFKVLVFSVVPVEFVAL